MMIRSTWKTYFVLISVEHVMLPLRFPNSGIKAKVFVQKIDFKQRVIKLNSVESFCIFLRRVVSKQGATLTRDKAVGAVPSRGQPVTRPQGRRLPVAKP
ncbi:hypothetical protein GW17_00060553 [Ensete ventricosum]|nr:hypothetical protein GW17_00060553 [Ensete ventricosum]